MVLESTTYPGHHRGGRSSRSSRPAASSSAATSSWPSPRSGWTRATSSSRPPRSRRSSAGSPRRARELAAALYRAGHQHRVRGLEPARGRDRQAAREHVPQREHRAGQRAGLRVPQDRGGSLGGHRGGCDQAVRLHALLSGAGHRRPLHPGGSALPLLEGAADRLRGAVHRAGRPDQPGHAGARGDPGGRRAERPGPGAARGRRSW